MKNVQLFYLGILFLTLFYVPVKAQVEIKVMSFNIRYDEPNDGENNWKYRKDNAAKVILFNDADVIGMQEVLHSQLVNLQPNLDRLV